MNINVIKVDINLTGSLCINKNTTQLFFAVLKPHYPWYPIPKLTVEIKRNHQNKNALAPVGREMVFINADDSTSHRVVRKKITINHHFIKYYKR